MQANLKPLRRSPIQFFYVFSFCLCFLFSGCVTESNSDLMKKKDKERYIQNSVAAALAYLQTNDTKNAFRHLNNAMEADPKSSEAHNAMALLYRSMQDRENEEKHFKLAIRYNPQMSKARNNYAVYLFQHERYKDALFQLDKATKDPAYDSRGLAFENMGRCYLGLKDIAQAEQSFKEALRVDSQLPRPYLELAQLNFTRGDLKQANQYLQQFGNLGRHTARSLWLGIQIERVLGHKDALASYEVALRNLFADSAEYKAYKNSLGQPALVIEKPVEKPIEKQSVADELMDISAPQPLKKPESL
jgi:type IV pilus assembly protein PilF